MPSYRIALIGPFGTRRMLETQHFAVNGYDGPRQCAIETLDSITVERDRGRGGQWLEPYEAQHRFSDYGDGLREQLSSLFPQYFIERGGPAFVDHIRDRYTALDRLVGIVPPSATWTLSDAGIGICDFRTGVAWAMYDVQVHEDSAAEYAVKLVGETKPLLNVFAGVVAETVELFHSLLEHPAFKPQRAWIRTDQAERDAERVPHGELYWLHALHLISTSGATLSEPLVEEWKGVLPTVEDRTVTTEGLSRLFLPGLGTSVLFESPSDGDAAVVDDLGSTSRQVLRALTLQSTYWAAASSIDRMLLRELNSVSLSARGDHLPEVRQAARTLQATADQVTIFQTVLANLTTHLAASTSAETLAWQRLAQAWRLSDRVSAIDGKLLALRNLYVDIETRRAASRSRVFTAAAGALTAFSASGVIYALFQFLEGNDMTSDKLRWTLGVSILAVGLLAAFVLLRWFLDRPPPNARGTRNRNPRSRRQRRVIRHP